MAFLQRLSLLFGLVLCYSSRFIYVDGMTLSMGLRSFVKRKFSFQPVQRTDRELKEGIANFYDESSNIWLNVWGEDMHHGYYPTTDYKDHRKAQTEMIEKSLEWGFACAPRDMDIKNIVDVGCGVGGSSRYMLKNMYPKAEANGLSLSPYQIERANEFTTHAGLSDRAFYQVADAMNMPFANDKFDLVWSMESAEHMPDKEQFMKELFRVTAPNGRILVVTWCHRELEPGETSLTEKEQKLLAKINKAYYLPEWCAPSTYVKIAEELGLEDIRSDDWTEYVAPFWPAVIKSALVPKNFVKMIFAGKKTLKGAVAAIWMLRGFQKKLIKFALITGRKPQ